MCERLPWKQAQASIDRCISNEVVDLAMAGAEPWSSCCGHGDPIQDPFVLVHNREVAVVLGYDPEPHLPGVLARDTWGIVPRTAERRGIPLSAVRRDRLYHLLLVGRWRRYHPIKRRTI